MKTRTFAILVILLAGTLLFSCGTGEQTTNETTEDELNAARTEAVATYASSLTESPNTAPEASPTLTLTPTLATPEVTPTAGTEQPPAPQNTCYNLLWIEDITIPDGTQLKANEKFTKTWLVQNNGGCAWAPGFTFSHVGGDSMRGAIVTLTEPVPVGAKREISVELVVPSGVNGLVQSSWRMADASGNYFGDTLTVNIVTGTVPTPTAQ